MHQLLPQKLIPVIIEISKINPEKTVNSITKEERLKLGHLLKNFTITISGFRPVEEAIITAGGINARKFQNQSIGNT